MYVIAVKRYDREINILVCFQDKFESWFLIKFDKTLKMSSKSLRFSQN